MESNNLLAVFFGLSSALTVAWGTVIRHRVSSTDSGALSIVRAMRSGWWWAGLIGALVGYLLQIIALRFGALLIVQPLLMLKLMFTLPLSARMDKRKISHVENGWAAVLTLAVMVLVVLGQPASGTNRPNAAVWLTALGLGTVIIGSVLAISRRLQGGAKALCLGAMTGSIMGYLALMSKAVVDTLTMRGFWGLLGGWELYVLLALAVVGTAVQQASFDAGALKNSLPAMTIAEPLVAFTLGYAVLDEYFQVESSAGWFTLGFALAAMIGSTVALSRLSAEERAEEK